MTIKVAQPGNSLGSQLAEAFRVFRNIRESDIDKLLVDLKALSRPDPALILPVASYLDRLKQEGISIRWSSDASLEPVLENIFFPDGFEFQFEKGRNVLRVEERAHIPIVRFSVDRALQMIDLWNEFLSTINERSALDADMSAQGKSTFSYLLSEMIDNILDHSITGNGWFFVMPCTEGAYIDFCIIDTGRGLLSSYRDFGIEGIEDDQDAIRAAIDGVSTKGIGRGHGIPSTRKMIEEGLSEEFILFSGNALRIHGRIVEAPMEWQGTLLAFRMPTDLENFDYLEYV